VAHQPLDRLVGMGERVPDVDREDLEAFAAGWPGCFRMVRDGAGRPAHCPKPPAWSGVFRNGRGRRHDIQAC
jgi:hypothetical protein